MTTSLKAVVWASLAVIIFSLASIIILKKTLEVPVKKAEKLLDSSAKVVVLNGCGRAGLASVFVSKLRELGFDVVNGLGGNADTFDFDISVVVDRKGVRGKAEAVGNALGISTILDQRSDNPYLIEDVTVILGRDWNTLQAVKEDVTY